jgi:subtilisin family serine protease
LTRLLPGYPIFNGEVCAMPRIIQPSPRSTRVIVKLPEGFHTVVESVVQVGQRVATSDRFVAFEVPGVGHERAMELIAGNLQANGGLSANDFEMEPDQIQMPSMPVVVNEDGSHYKINSFLGWLLHPFRRKPTPNPAPAPKPAEPTSATLDPQLYHITQTGFDHAWAQGFTGKGVLVGVNDTGCGPAKHVPYQSNINTVGFDDPVYEDDNDHHGHGTHCAGIATASFACDQGIWGGAPEANLKVFKSGVGYFYTSDLMQAIDEAIKAGVLILSNSWGGPPSKFMQETITRALKAGMVIVKATGNENAVCPDPYHDCVLVSALDQWNRPSVYSNWVPDEYVASTIATYGDNILSHLPGEKTGFMSGTSMATPVVTGALAVLASKYKGVKGLDLMQHLLTRCILPLSQTRYGCGRLSLLREFGANGTN